MSTVLLVGAFGQGDPGAETLGAAFRTALADHDVTVASSDPAGTARRLGVRTIPADPVTVARATRSADALVFGGGTIFQAQHTRTGMRPTRLLRDAAALTALARASGTKVAMVGVGAADLHGLRSRSLSRWLVRHVDLLVLRDEDSAGVLADAGAPTPFRIGADPVWSLGNDPVAVDARPRPSRRITVALGTIAGDDPFGTNLAEVLGWLPDRYSVRVQPWQEGPNGRGLELPGPLRARRGVEVAEPPDDIAAATRGCVGDELVIGLHFHALVAAALAGTRFVAVAHDPKVLGLSRRLGQVSLPPHATPAVMAGAIAHAVEHEPPAAERVRAEVVGARRSLDLLRLLLSCSSAEEPQEFAAALPLAGWSGTW